MMKIRNINRVTNCVLIVTALSGLASFLPFSTGWADVVRPADLTLVEESGIEWEIPSDAKKISVLVVGGGGGGAPGLGNAAGGGGAGGLVYVDDYLKKYNAKPGDAVEIKVGLPGAIVSMTQGRRGFPGLNSCFGKIVALGGGGGGRGQNIEAVHHASSGGSAGGGTMGTNAPVALQPAESGVGIGFGHPGGGALGSGGGGAGGPGTLAGQGGGGIGLQGVPLEQYLDPATGFATNEFDAKNPAHYKLLFRELFGLHFGDDGWFAGGGALNASYHKDEGGQGGGSKRHAMPHTGGGGGGSTHGYEGGAPGLGGSGVVLVRCLHGDDSATVHGWGLKQPDAFVLRRMLDEPAWLRDRGQYEEALVLLDAHDPARFSVPVRVEILRAYGQIYAGQGREAESLEKFDRALLLEAVP